MRSTQTLYTDPRIQNARLWQGILVTAVICLVLLAGIWIWKSMQIRAINQKAEEYRVLVKEQAARQVLQVQENQLKSLAKPLVWALRAEMMKGNTEKINLYIDDLIKENNVQSMTVTNPNGKVLASSERKTVGKAFPIPWEDTEKKANETLIKRLDEHTLLMASPIMGFNNRLGTVYLQYSVQPLNL